MTSSPEVRQLAEKLHAKGICQTMASAFQMAESMLVTSVKVNKDFNSHFENKESIRPSSNPSVKGMPVSVTSMFDVSEIATEGGNAISDHDQKRINSSVFDEPKDPLDDDKDKEPEDDSQEEERVSTMFHPVSQPKIEAPKPLFHAPPTSGMTLHELMDTGNGELRFDGSKVHYNEQKMPEAIMAAPVESHISVPSVAPVEAPKPVEMPKAVAVETPEVPQATTVELPKAPVQASRAELEKKNALYQKVDLSAVFGVKK